MFPGYVTMFKDKDEFVHLYFYPGLDNFNNFYYRDLDLTNCQVGYNETDNEDELDEALKRDLISKEEFDMAYETRNKIIQMIKNDFDKLKSFTQKSLDKLIHE